MYKFLFIMLLFVFTANLFSQNFDTTHYRKNAVYFEGFGNVIPGYSLNYERKIAEGQNSFISCRVGFAYNFYGNLTSPLLFNRINNKQKSDHLEFGIGMTFYFLKYRNSAIVLDQELNPSMAGNLMYRYQKPGGRFILRAGWTPSYFFNIDDKIEKYLFLFIVGASVGYSF